MTIKFIMTWDIQPGKEQEYFEFVVRTFMPGVNQIGLNLEDAWVTIYGEQPQIQVGALVPDMQGAQKILQSDAWHDLNTRLQEYVDNYQFKLVPLKGAFQF